MRHYNNPCKIAALGISLALSFNVFAQEQETNLRHPTLASDSYEPVGTVLLLALDSSSSISNEEWKIQTQATATALTSKLVKSTIRCKAGLNSIAIGVVEFSHNAALRIPFVDIRASSCKGKDPEFEYKIQSLGAQIASLKRQFRGRTSLGNMLEYSVDLFKNTPWSVKEKRVLDVSGDGINNHGAIIDTGRDKLINLGVTINGLAIVNEEKDLDEYFEENLITTDFVLGLDANLMSVPGRVWSVARNMKDKDNDITQLQTYSAEMVLALKSKISTEIVFNMHLESKDKQRPLIASSYLNKK